MIILLFYILTVFEYQEPGGSSSALLISSFGNSTYTATSVNPAILSHLNLNGVGMIYGQPYNINDIQYTRLSGNYKNFGVSVSRLGHNAYQEYNISLSTGFNYNPNLSYGVIVKGLYLDLKDYGQNIIPAFNFGLSYQTDKLKFGAVLENINNPKTIIGDEIPWAIITAAVYQPVSDFMLGVELRKTDQDENIYIGSELKLLPDFAVRIGTQTNPFIISSGLGFTFKNLYFDYALKFHTRLKDTSVFSLGYFW